MHRWLNGRVVLTALLGAALACLNPDISDEYPLTLEADALDVDEGGESADEEALDDSRGEEALDDGADDDSEEPVPSADESDESDDGFDDSAPADRRARPRRSGARR